MEKQSDIIRKAQQLHINEQYTQSNQSLSIISQSNNPKFNIYKLKARNYLELHQLQNAKLNAYETIKRAPNKPDGYLIKARIYLMMGKYEESLPILEKAFINDQKCIEYFYLKAYALTKLGKYGESKQYYEKCFIRQTDYNPLTFIGKAELLILTNQVDQAKKCIQYAKKATRQQGFQKTVSRSDRRRLKRCLQAYNQIMQMIKKVQEAGTKYYKKISKQKRIIQKDYIKNMNEAIFLKNIDIIEAMTKKYKKLLNNEYSIDDISEAQTTDSTSIFSCCFSKQQHTC